jgi:CDP-diacylglycerol--serine O-phosphatidyltransferase
MGRNEMKPGKLRTNRRLRRGAYLLPSLFTIGNILIGFYAVIRGFRGDFQTAALLIFLAGILDGLDGRIARLTRTESDFGREFDSLADVLTFGAAPALLTYLWGLHEWGRIGWLVPLFFLLATAIRLARFNVQSTPQDRRFFVGLPAPAGAAVLAFLLYFLPRESSAFWLYPLLLVALIATGILMLSTFRYHSFKGFDLRQKWSYRSALLFAAMLLVFSYHPPSFLSGLAIIYALSGPVFWLVPPLRRRLTAPHEDPEATRTSS